MKRGDFVSLAQAVGITPLMANKCVEVAGSVREATRLLIAAQGDLLPADEVSRIRQDLDAAQQAPRKQVADINWVPLPGASRWVRVRLLYAEPKTRDECMAWMFTFGIAVGESDGVSDAVRADEHALRYVPIASVWQMDVTDSIGIRLMNTTERCTKERFGGVRQIDIDLAGSSGIYLLKIAAVNAAPRRKAGCWVDSAQLTRSDPDTDPSSLISTLDQLTSQWQR